MLLHPSAQPVHRQALQGQAQDQGRLPQSAHHHLCCCSDSCSAPQGPAVTNRANQPDITIHCWQPVLYKCQREAITSTMVRASTAWLDPRSHPLRLGCLKASSAAPGTSSSRPLRHWCSLLSTGCSDASCKHTLITGISPVLCTQVLHEEDARFEACRLALQTQHQHALTCITRSCSCCMDRLARVHRTAFGGRAAHHPPKHSGDLLCHGADHQVLSRCTPSPSAASTFY